MNQRPVALNVTEAAVVSPTHTKLNKTGHFMSAFNSILYTDDYTSFLGDRTVIVAKAIQEAIHSDLVSRIWSRDYTAWRPVPAEISNRLGWLDIADRMMAEIPAIESFVKDAVADGFTHVLLLGMGGSSLAPEVFQKVFGQADGYLDLAMLDSTDPATVMSYTKKLDPAKTLYIVSSKSGGTVETLSFFRFFFRHLVGLLGEEEAGKHFVAITDPGSWLGGEARDLKFRMVFENDPHIGGRFSALSHFGLVPAALLGIDLKKLLTGAIEMAKECRKPAPENPGAQLGVAMAALARVGRDKVTVQAAESLGSLGDWIEQLIAESSGKNGTGLVPVVNEEAAAPEAFGSDRFFVQIAVGNEAPDSSGLVSAGHPVVQLGMRETYALGAQFFLWEMATSIACADLGINAFDQPNVESAKVVAREKMKQFEEKGSLPPSNPVPASAETITSFISEAAESDYIGILAYLTPSESMAASLSEMRRKVRDLTGLATVSGFGPRYLHSSGQLHKGDRGNGRFIVLTANTSAEAPIPAGTDTDEAVLSFGVLIAAQALGDIEALGNEKRPVLHMDLGAEPEEALKELANGVA